jgi:hypothetical protein
MAAARPLDFMKNWSITILMPKLGMRFRKIEISMAAGGG